MSFAARTFIPITVYKAPSITSTEYQQHQLRYEEKGREREEKEREREREREKDRAREREKERERRGDSCDGESMETDSSGVEEEFKRSATIK